MAVQSVYICGGCGVGSHILLKNEDVCSQLGHMYGRLCPPIRNAIFYLYLLKPAIATGSEETKPEMEHIKKYAAHIRSVRLGKLVHRGKNLFIPC